jgi:hypothetical protein
MPKEEVPGTRPPLRTLIVCGGTSANNWKQEFTTFSKAALNIG